MTIYERLDEINATELTLDNVDELLHKFEEELVGYIGAELLRKKVSLKNGEVGIITDYHGTALDKCAVIVEFASGQKKYAIDFIINNAINPNKFIQTIEFVETSEITNIIEAWNALLPVHNNLMNKLAALKTLARQLEAEAKKKAAADKKAEEAYNRTKSKAIYDFEQLTQTITPKSSADAFYLALGWLVKHCGTVGAALPDYLESAFAKYFGADTPCRIVDSKHRGPAGWQSQWTWSFSVSLKKPDVIPAVLTKYVNPKGTAITDTSFVWDLVDNYGFQFGKTQDIEKIRSCVPADYLTFFEAGLA